MSAIPFNLSGTVVTCCATLLDPDALDLVVQEHRAVGLSQAEVLEDHLQKSDYVPVLKAIWGEEDSAKRVEWLRSHSSQLHAPLLYELAIGEFVVNPIADTVHKLSLPLLKSARFRAEQDVSCLRVSVNCEHLGEYLDHVYLSVLDREVKRALGTSLEEVFQSKEELRRAMCLGAVKAIGKKSMEKQLPQPYWVTGPVMDLFEESMGMYPEGAQKIRTDAFAQALLKRLFPEKELSLI